MVGAAESLRTKQRTKSVPLVIFAEGAPHRSMTTLRFLDPRAAVTPNDQPLVPGLDTLEGKIIGIIDNGQANSTDMFKELSRLLQDRLHTREVLFKTKPTHMQGAPKAIMEEVIARCDAVITGLGA